MELGGAGSGQFSSFENISQLFLSAPYLPLLSAQSVLIRFCPSLTPSVAPVSLYRSYGGGLLENSFTHGELFKLYYSDKEDGMCKFGGVSLCIDPISRLDKQDNCSMTY